MSRRRRLVLGIAVPSLLLVAGVYAALARSGGTADLVQVLELREEFTAERAETVRTLDGYLALENRLFAELDAALAGREGELRLLSRYFPGSPTNLRGAATDWNRTFRRHPEGPPTGGALLLHGLTDSPYNVRYVAKLLEGEGFEILGLRLPGHGTIPTGIGRATVEDWRAAVELGAREISGAVEAGQPFVLVGYSLGAALALDYTLRALDDPMLRVPDRLVLLSPALAAPPIARAAAWQARLSRLPGLGHIAWTESLPEVDPFKYNSFPAFAGDQYYRLTVAVEEDLAGLEEDGRFGELPPVLVIQSVVDATVPPQPSLSRLFGRPIDPRSELVLFDANRMAVIDELLDPHVDDVVRWLAADADLPFVYTLVTNAGSDEPGVRAVTRRPGSAGVMVETLGLEWPPDAFSLSHVAIPIPPEDPVYGVDLSLDPPLPFGLLELRGERELLQIPQSLIARMRYNPFFPYVERRISDFVAGRHRGAAPAPSNDRSR